MKAIVLLKYFKTKKGTTYKMRCKVNEAIAELEALENRSCDGCEYDNDSISDSLDYCANCVRSYKDNYKAKE